MNQVVGRSQAEDTVTRQKVKRLISKALIIFYFQSHLTQDPFCLDECHHLRNEWWKGLEAFIKAFPD